LADTGKLSGDQVKPVLMKSNLDVARLGQIWCLSDIDQDGLLNEYEFTIAMHLTYKALAGAVLPETLPSELLTLDQPQQQPTLTMPEITPVATPTIEHLITPPTPQMNMTLGMGMIPPPAGNFIEAPVVPPEDKPFCVTPDKQPAYAKIFASQADAQNGFISAMEARAVFLQSGLPNATLAQVWNLADASQKGNLVEAEFVLSMHLLAAVLQGYELPSVISEHMKRAASGKFTDTEKVKQDYIVPSVPQVEPELQSLANELSQLQAEVAHIEAAVSQLSQQQNGADGQLGQLQTTIDSGTQQLTSHEAENAQLRQQLDEVDQQTKKAVMEQNELNSKLMQEHAITQQLQQELIAFQSAPAPGTHERAEHDQLKMSEQRLEKQKTEALKMLTDVRAEKMRTAKLLGELEIEKKNNEMPMPSASGASFGAKTPTPPPPAAEMAQPEQVSSSLQPRKPIETSLSEMSLKSDLLSPSSNSTEITTPITAALNNLSSLTNVTTTTTDQNQQQNEPKSNFGSLMDDFMSPTTAQPIVAEQVDDKHTAAPAIAAVIEPASLDAFGEPISDDPFAPVSASVDFNKDPFGSSSDPFGDSKDPFAASTNKTDDPFGSAASMDKTDPFGQVAESSDKMIDPFQASSPQTANSDPFGDSSTSGFGELTDVRSSDPFGATPATTMIESKTDDPFGGDSSNSDPWGSITAPTPSSGGGAADFGFDSAFDAPAKVAPTTKKAPSRPPPPRP